MQSNRYWSLALLPALALAGIYALQERPSSPSAKLPAEPRAKLETEPSAERDRRLDANDFQLRQLSAQVAALSAAQATTAAPVAPQSVVEAEAEPPDAAGLEGAYHEQAALLDDALVHGVKDDWARAHQRELSASLAETIRALPDASLTLDSVECAAALCRAHLTPSASADANQALGVLRAQMTWSGERFYKLVPGDHPEIVIYAGREGATLPRVAMLDGSAQ